MIVVGLGSFAALAAATAQDGADDAAAQAAAHPAPTQNGITSVTDGAGNPVPRDTFAGPPPALRRESMGGAVRPEVQRGQAWWPYRTALPPYTSVNVTAEAMSENQIMINGVALVSVDAPEAAFQQMPKELLLDPGSQLSEEDGFYLVKIKGFSRSQQQVDALEAAGAVLGELLNINTYIAKIPAASYASVRALPFVSYIGDYHPAYKISPRIGLESIPVDEVTDQATGRALPWLLEVSLHKGARLEEVLTELGYLGIVPQPEEIASNEGLTVVLARTTPENIPALAKIPGVKWIAEKTFPRLLASASSPTVIPMVLQNNGAFTTSTGVGWKLWNAGIDGNASGTAQVVTVMDTGLNTKMEHFSQDILSAGTVGASHRKVVGYDNYGGDLCVNNYLTADGGHGTWTSQHAVGSISNMTSNVDTTHTPNTYYDDGIARDAKVYFQDIGTAAGTLSAPLDLGPSIGAAIAKGSYVQNHSWGTSSPTYDTTATNLDTAIFNNPNFVVTVAAGNNGTVGAGSIGSPCTAKNCICVGGADVAQPNYLFEDCTWDGVATCGGAGDLGSARGPVTTSNRVKPDICAYMAFSATVGGENEAGNRPSAMCQTDATKTVYWDWTNSNGFGGTSFSAPEVAGLAAVVRDYFQAGFYPTGSATPANAVTPAGSLVKALILASGEDMNTTGYPTTSIAINKRYSNDVGYGRTNLPSVLHIGSGAPFLWVQNGDTLGEGATKSFYYTINGNSMPLRVMMVYYDAAGNALQKDCDLRVTIGANVYWGNNFSGGWSTSATSTRDHTNPTEGVLLDAVHGLPASGTVQVDVIAWSNPGGMPYSLVVSGDVAAQNVTQVSLDKAKYTCNDTVRVTVNDAAGSSPVSVTLTSKNGGGTTIDTKAVSCSGTGGVFTGTIQTGSGITVVDGGSIVATYAAVTPAAATIACTAALADGGFLISGGCDNAAAGTDAISGPLSNGGSNEYYTKYMDGGEYTAYTMGFVNQTGAPLTDVYVSLSFSGAGASKMTVLNNPVHVGAVPTDGLAGPVFQVYTDPSVAGLTAVNMDFDITSPPNGYTTPKRLTQVQYLQANDTVARQASCSPFDTALTPWYESTVTGAVANTWRWIGSASTPATVSSENRTDGSCGNATANAGAMVGNSSTLTNFANNADSFLLLNFQPALRGNAPNGQPYHYAWKWHSFYHASETLSNQGGVWGAFYNDQWNSAVNPTADQAQAFPISLSYYYHTIFDYVGTWNWDTANTGIPDDPHYGPTSGGAPNQIIITFGSATTGLATSSTYFAYGHEHADVYWFNGGTSHGTHRDIALDNDRLVYDEWYTASQAGASCGAGGQVGQVAFDRYTYDDCPASSAILSVTDANATGPLTVTVTSPGTGDSEVVTLTGTAPYFSGTLALSTISGRGTNNGTLLVLPAETLGASYTDTSPAGTSTASAYTGCTGGSVVLLSKAQVSDNGDNDGIADNNETVTMDITIQNNMATPLTNAKVVIIPDTSNVDCVIDNQALYGTVAAGATATNPTSDRFTFHVSSPVACSDWQNPPVAKFTVIITGDGMYGSSSLQTFTVTLDLDTTSTGGSYTYSQTFTTDPGWATGATADDDGSCTQAWANNFHWCAACGNAGGGYGAWIGNSAFGTSGQNYSEYDSSTLYSPVFTANGSVGLTFSVAYRTESGYDGALVQSKVGTGAWTNLAFTTPAQSATTAGCMPLSSGASAWTGTGSTWTTTSASTVAATAGQTIQFRWRLGSDSTVGGTTYGGYGVDNVSVTGLKQTLVCEPTRNTGLPGCPADCAISPNGTPCNDGNACTQTDTCQGGLCVGSSPVTCTALDQCHDAGTCNTGTGVCSNPNKPNGTACNDSNACTQTDTCQSGTCTGSNSVVCTALDQCHDVGTCNTGTGVCSNPNKPNGTACNDGNACTQTDTCQSGSCAGGNPVTCTALDQCHDVGTCNTGTGVCSNPNKPNGTACNDGNTCTGSDVCTGGTCGGIAYGPPTEVANQRFSSKTAQDWDAATGGGPGLVYDVVRGDVGQWPVGSGAGEQCRASGTSGTSLTVAENPPSGSAFWFLVRARTTCGTGSYGNAMTPGPVPRTTTTCP